LFCCWGLSLNVDILAQRNTDTLHDDFDRVLMAHVKDGYVDNDALVTENGYDNLNISASYEPMDGNWLVTLGVNNVTNEEYIVAGDSNGTLGYRLAVFARPRNWYLNLEYQF